jgi:hypothetical protein
VLRLIMLNSSMVATYDEVRTFRSNCVQLVIKYLAVLCYTSASILLPHLFAGQGPYYGSPSLQFLDFLLHMLRPVLCLMSLIYI